MSTISVPELEERVTLNAQLEVVRSGDQLMFWVRSGPLYSCSMEDRLSRRYAGAMLSELGLARAEELAEVLGSERSTIFRNRRVLRTQGIESLKHPKRGPPRSEHKLIGEVREQAQQGLNEGLGQREIARRVGVSEGTIRYGLKKRTLTRKASVKGKQASRPGSRARQAMKGKAGVAVERHQERHEARVVLLDEAPPVFEKAEGVASLGVLLALPALLHEGLLSVGESTYGSLKGGFYGLRTVLLCLALMALLRIKNVEQLAAHAPGELGLLLGLDRVPEVKTLRRKLAELGEAKRADELANECAKRWSQEAPQALGFLYIDGHVRAYHGRKHKLPKTFVQKRRLCMPAATDVWVNDQDHEPVFVVTTEANNGLLSMLEHEVIPRARQQLGPERRFTLIFDREAWSPKSYRRWFAQGIDVMTYRKGKQTRWPVECFETIETSVEGEVRRYALAQRSVLIFDKTRSFPAFWMREVRRLCDNGHQTAILTTRQDLEVGEVAWRMFARWRQENFFKYMQSEFALDHLISYAVEPANADRLIPNPAYQAQQTLLKQRRSERDRCLKDYGQSLYDQNLTPEESTSTPSSDLPTISASWTEQIQALDEQCQTLESVLKLILQKIPIQETRSAQSIVQHERERKVLTDTLKMLAYQAETDLVRLIQPVLARPHDDARQLIQRICQLPSDLIPNESQQQLIVRLYGLSNHRSQRALRVLCEAMNQEKTFYPGTSLQLVFETIESQ